MCLRLSVPMWRSVGKCDASDLMREGEADILLDIEAPGAAAIRSWCSTRHTTDVGGSHDE